MNLKRINSIKIFFLSWFSFTYPVIENFRSNIIVLFKSEMLQILIFIIVIGVIALLVHILNQYYFKISPKKLISFQFIIFLFFWNYKKITTSVFSFFNEINNSGIVVYLILLSILLFFLLNESIYKYVFNIVSILFILQAVLLTYTFFIYNFDFSISNIDEENLNSTEIINKKTKPDIYFLLFDAVAENSYNVENFNIDMNNILKEFENFELEIFEDEYSNYGGTGYQMSSIMEMGPMHMNKSQVSNSEIYTIVNKTKDNETAVEKYFIDQGYVLFKYGLFFRCQDEINVVCIGDSTYQVNTVISDIVDQTPLRVLKEKKIIQLNSSTSDVIKYLFFNTCGLVNQKCQGQDIREILDYKKVEEPKLFLLHFMFTHSPFYLDGECKPYLEEVEMPDFNSVGYADSLNCMYLEIQRLLNFISDESVVIIQSDHGPFEITRDRSNKNQLNEEIVKSQYSILSISNINKFCEKKVNTFSGINTFSNLINCLTNEEVYKINSDNYFYYILGSENHEFINISDMINSLKK